MKTSLGISLSLLAFAAAAQVPVDDQGRPVGDVYSSDIIGVDDGATRYATDADALRTVAELEDLIAPIALYPDDLLAIVLPAATFPLQVVEAARFLDAVADDDSLKPDDDWDDSVVALLNYPEVVELLNNDLDWTFSLGEAVVAQQQDVLTAIDSFRDRAMNAGNLQTDQYQQVAENDEGIIEITPIEDDVIYVPYYEPEEVVVYQTRPVYHYYTRPYPVYYYPYPVNYVHFSPFWGVTTAFDIGWSTWSLHVWHPSVRGHPFFGSVYRDFWWYRRPSIHVYNNRYFDGGRHNIRRHYRYGDYWRPSRERRWHPRTQRVARSTVPYSERRSAVRRYGDGDVLRRSGRDDRSRAGNSRGRQFTNDGRTNRSRTGAGLERSGIRQGFAAGNERRDAIRRQETGRRDQFASNRRAGEQRPAASRRPESRARTPGAQRPTVQRTERRRPVTSGGERNRPSAAGFRRAPERSVQRQPSRRVDAGSRRSYSSSPTRRAAPTSRPRQPVSRPSASSRARQPMSRPAARPRTQSSAPASRSAGSASRSPRQTRPSRDSRRR